MPGCSSIDSATGARAALGALTSAGLTLAWRGQNVWTVVAVLRALPALARQLVLRLAYLDAPADVSQWVAKSAAGAPPRPPCTMCEGASHVARCGLFLLSSCLFQSVGMRLLGCVSPGVRSDCAHRGERERGGGERKRARDERDERDEIVTRLSSIGVFYWCTRSLSGVLGLFLVY